MAELLAHRDHRTFVVVTAPKAFPEGARNLFKDQGILPSWWGGEEPWFPRWEGKVRGSAINGSWAQQRHHVTLLYIVRPDTGFSSHMEWAERQKVRQNILAEAHGAVSTVSWCVISEQEARTFLGI